MTYPYPPYDIWGTFLHTALFSGLTMLVGGLLFVACIMWAEYKAERDAWEQQETRKLKAVRK